MSLPSWITDRVLPWIRRFWGLEPEAEVTQAQVLVAMRKKRYRPRRPTPAEIKRIRKDQRARRGARRKGKGMDDERIGADGWPTSWSAFLSLSGREQDALRAKDPGRVQRMEIAYYRTVESGPSGLPPASWQPRLDGRE